MATRKVIKYDSLILTNLTIEKEGHDPSILGKTSTKYIWANCYYCGEPSRLTKGNYTKLGSACHKKCKLEQQKQQISPFADPVIKAKAHQTILERYGTEYASQNKQIAIKISETKQKNKLPQMEIFYRDQEIKQIGIVAKCLEEKFQDICLYSNIISPITLDIFIPSKNFAICFNSNYLHSEANGKNRRCLLDKLIACRYKNIRLFNIFEYHWDKRQKQILNFIKSILGLNNISIMARKCNQSNISAKDFIQDNHIQGYGNGTIMYFNLEYNNEIVASMTASKHHRPNIVGNPIVLNRLCFKDGYNVQGGSSKLFKSFISWAKENNYDRIISWSDNCWTEGNIYKILGFDLTAEYGPDYFYWDRDNNRYFSKQSQKKDNASCPSGSTEHEWCRSRGFYRIYDCGKKRWEYKLTNKENI